MKTRSGPGAGLAKLRGAREAHAHAGASHRRRRDAHPHVRPLVDRPAEDDVPLQGGPEQGDAAGDAGGADDPAQVDEVHVLGVGAGATVGAGVDEAVAEHDRVVALAAERGVVGPEASDQRVGAPEPLQAVRPAGAVEGVVTAASGEGVVAAGADDLLDVGAHVVLLSAAPVVVRAVERHGDGGCEA